MDLIFLHIDREKTDWTGWIKQQLILVFAEHTSHVILSFGCSI